MAAVETKTAAGSSVAAVTGAITWILVTYVPAFHSGIPGPLATFLPYVVSAVLGAAAAYLAPHTPREEEIVSAALKLLQDAGVQIGRAHV